MLIRLPFFILLFSCLYACQPAPQVTEVETVTMDTTAYPLVIPTGFPQPKIPANNQLTNARVALGKKLFYEPILSLDSTITCASCHILSKGMADNLRISPGVHGANGFRNPPTLTNVAYLDLVNKDGGVRKLGLQALVPIEDHDEMNVSILEVSKRLNESPTYVEMAQRAYGRNPDPFVISRALAAFQRTMISGNSRYDQYHFQNDKNALTEQEKRGMELFFSEKLNCSACHIGFNFTDNAFKNNGLYAEYEDQGRQRVTSKDEDNGLFRVPTLRNIALTFPYMHDGSVGTLEEVIEHYASGGVGHRNQSEEIRDFKISQQEKADVVAFLGTLTDSSFVNNSLFLP
ncbi:MAG: cytochrome-c peroxidase [Saprospiraceae bacterium]